MLSDLLISLFVLWLSVTFAAMVTICYLFSTLPTMEQPSDGQRPELEGEVVRFPTADGVFLAGTFVPAPGRHVAPCVICAHRFASHRHDAARVAAFLPESGFHLFAFDFRGHGESGSDEGYRPEPWVTWREREDVLAAITYCEARSDVVPDALGLFGLSRGANAALCAAVAHPAVRAVVAEGAFSTREILKRYVKLKAPRYVGLPWVWRHFPDPLFGFITDLSLGAMRLLLRRRYLSVERAVGATNARPCFFIHAEKDFIVSLALAKQLYTKASQPKSLWVIPGAQHAEGFHAAPKVYGTRVVNFFREHLN